MKAIILYAVLLILSLGAKAQQFVIINDPDGYVNVRKDSNVKSAIVWKAYNGGILINYDTDGKLKNWLNVATATDVRDSLGKRVELKNENLHGFVYANRVILISKLPHIKSRQIVNNKLVIKNDSILLTVLTRPFNNKNHTVHKGTDGWLDKLDGKVPYGVDGRLPHVEISAIELVVNDRYIKIPHSAFNDLYEPSLWKWNIYLNNKGDIYICSENSDGAGYYDVVWVISNGKLARRYVDNSNA